MLIEVYGGPVGCKSPTQARCFFREVAIATSQDPSSRFYKHTFPRYYDIIDKMAVGDVLTLKLESIVAGGEALGRVEGKTVFVEGGAPEETVLCRITGEHGAWARGEILEIIEPSPLRVDSVCASYGKCGGCNLQHLSYQGQLDSKISILKDSFLRIGGFSAPEICVFPSPTFEYRNRVQFHCFREYSQTKGARSKTAAQLKNKSDYKPKFGLKGRKSDEIIAVPDCPVAVKGIRELLKSGGKELPLPVEKDRFTVFSAGEVLLSEGGKARGKITLLKKEVLLDAGVFFQSNAAMLEKLILKLQELAEGADRSLPMADLYCGIGTFAIFLGDMFTGAVLAEENKTAISIARENLRGYKNIEFYALRDNEWIKALLGKKPGFGFAVLDPPRAGLSPKLAQTLAKEGPPLLAYVSCDPQALARDAKILTGSGYSLRELSLFDFYPQTSHIEALAVFYRN